MNAPLVSVRDLSVTFGSTEVLHNISMSIGTGRTVGVVGESGSGKSTLAKVLVGLVRHASGNVTVDSVDVRTLGHRSQSTAAYRRRVQLIPQDPFSSLSPRRTIGQTLAEAIDPRHDRVDAHRELITEWLERVGLASDTINRYPHEFSGGQRQRIAIARGLIVNPSFVIADEITSALDVSVQAQILDLVADIKRAMGLTMMFISHNLAVVQQVSDEIVVLYRGEIVEAGAAADVYANPQHWYTQQLLDADPGSPGYTLDTSTSR